MLVAYFPMIKKNAIPNFVSNFSQVDSNKCIKQVV